MTFSRVYEFPRVAFCGSGLTSCSVGSLPLVPWTLRKTFVSLAELRVHVAEKMRVYSTNIVEI